MKRSLAAATLLLFFLLGIGTTAFAGDNAGAVVSIEADKVADVGPDEIITVSVMAEGLVNAKNFLVGLQFDPAALTPGTVQVNTDVLPAGFPGWAVFSKMDDGGTLMRIAGAALGDVPVSVAEAAWLVRVR